MKKPILLLVIGGFLIIVGIGLSVYGSQLIIENLATQERQIETNMQMEISKKLDPSINEDGVYVVQVADFKDGSVDATVFDPFGQIVTSKHIEQNPYQDSFKISSSGTYMLVIENKGETIDVTAVIGYLPQDESLMASIFGFIVIIIGLIGLGVGIMYFIRSRSKTEFN